MSDPQDRDREETPTARKSMSIVRWALLICGVALFAAGLALYWPQSSAPEEQPGQVQNLPVYYCPMHPNYTAHQPGECPICGMTLVLAEPTAGQAQPAATTPATAAAPAAMPDMPDMPSEAAEPTLPADAQSAAPEISAGSEPPGLAVVSLSPERVQKTGVITAEVRMIHDAPALKAVGLVAVDESLSKDVSVRFSGWVSDLYVSRIGDRVTRGTRLASIYSPEVLAAEQDYLVALGATGELTSQLSPSARRRLELLGVPETELQRIERERTARDTIDLVAPASGVVLVKNVNAGSSVAPQTALFTIAGLSPIWVLAEAPEAQAGRLEPGMRAEVSAAGRPGAEPLIGKVGYIYPEVRSDSRSVRVRIELPNRDTVLLPGMYCDVRLFPQGSQHLVVAPADAIIRTQDRTYAFVERSPGLYEPVEVRIGARIEDDYEVLAGLSAGDRVVTSAAFLIDSESRIKAALTGLRTSPAAPAAAGHQGYGR